MEKEDDLDGFMLAYNNNNRDLRRERDFYDGEYDKFCGLEESLQNGASLSPKDYERYKELREKYIPLREKNVILKGICYQQVIPKPNNPIDPVDYKKVGTLIGATYISHKGLITGKQSYYWLVKFSDDTLTFQNNMTEFYNKGLRPCSYMEYLPANKVWREEQRAKRIAESQALKADVPMTAAQIAAWEKAEAEGEGYRKRQNFGGGGRTRKGRKGRKGRKQGRRQTRRSRS